METVYTCAVKHLSPVIPGSYDRVIRANGKHQQQRPPEPKVVTKL